jgi:hypothetical protein
LLEVKQVVRETEVGAAQKVLDRWLDNPAVPGSSSLLQLLDQSQ